MIRKKGSAVLGPVVRRPDSAIHRIAIFSTFVKLAVDRYNLRLRFDIYKLKFLRSIVGSRGRLYKTLNYSLTTFCVVKS